MAQIAYRFENPKEKYPAQAYLLPSLLEILELLKQFPNVNLIAGDVHQFVMSRICHTDGTCIKQMVASGMTKGSSVIGEFKLLNFFAFGKYFTGHVIGNWTLNHDEQFLDNNYGVVDVDETGDFVWYGKYRQGSSFETIWKNLYFKCFPLIAFLVTMLVAYGVQNYFFGVRR
jgi:hypothetical protein